MSIIGAIDSHTLHTVITSAPILLASLIACAGGYDESLPLQKKCAISTCCYVFFAYDYLIFTKHLSMTYGRPLTVFFGIIFFIFEKIIQYSTDYIDTNRKCFYLLFFCCCYNFLNFARTFVAPGIYRYLFSIFVACLNFINCKFLCQISQ